jgi:predicted acetyltransferase
VARLNRRETDPEAPLVPETTYWGTLDGEVVGRISMRHRLNENLSKVGGHIGYEVGPSHRRMGTAKEMLRLILLTPKAREIGRLLLTCSPGNPASIRTIVSNGGVLEKTVFVDSLGEERRLYWITIGH